MPELHPVIGALILHKGLDPIIDHTKIYIENSPIFEKLIFFVFKSVGIFVLYTDQL